MKKYIDFKSYYINNFKIRYESAVKIKNSDCNMQQKYEELIILFETSFLLLKYYLQNNGLFQFTEQEVLREAFYIDFLDDGEEWMEVCTIIKDIHSKGFSESNYEHIQYIYDNLFFIFSNLNNKFLRLVV